MLSNIDMIWETPEELDLILAQRIRKLRRRRKLSQQKLSENSGVPLGTVKRFESTGKVSLLAFTKLLFALGCDQELRNLLTQVPYNDIQEVINEHR